MEQRVSFDLCGKRALVTGGRRGLIRQMWQANPSWGSPRIVGELQELGIDIAKSTVEKYRPKLRGPTSPSWTTFLKQHIQDIVAIDFFTVPAGAIASAVRADCPGPRSAPGRSLQRDGASDERMDGAAAR